MLLCVVDTLEHARLSEDGIHTPASDSIDKEIERRRTAEEQPARVDVRAKRRHWQTKRRSGRGISRRYGGCSAMTSSRGESSSR